MLQDALTTFEFEEQELPEVDPWGGVGYLFAAAFAI